MGDNVYIDAPTEPAIQRYVYYRRQSRPEFRRFVSSTPTYAVWDDHDFAWDNSGGGPDPDAPTWKPDVLDVFRQNWIEPSDAAAREVPGVWFTFSIGDVDVFVLDGRYYRSNPLEPGGSMLGTAQKEWLMRELRSSAATFKLIASPVPWAASANPEPDAWDAYPEEREEIFHFIREQRISGVVLVSADRHRSDMWMIPQDGSYSLPEFASSRLTNHHKHAETDLAVFSYNNKPSFGQITFDFTLEDPAIKYSIFSIDDELMFEYELHATDLQAPLAKEDHP